jgi:hypothetical protein
MNKLITSILLLLFGLFAFQATAQPELEEQQNADFEILKNLELFGVYFTRLHFYRISILSQA